MCGKTTTEILLKFVRYNGISEQYLTRSDPSQEIQTKPRKKRTLPENLKQNLTKKTLSCAVIAVVIVVVALVLLLVADNLCRGPLRGQLSTPTSSQKNWHSSLRPTYAYTFHGYWNILPSRAASQCSRYHSAHIYTHTGKLRNIFFCVRMIPISYEVKMTWTFFWAHFPVFSRCTNKNRRRKSRWKIILNDEF